MMTFQICLAPLKGITDALFRTTLAEFFSGVDRAVSPFLSTTSGSRVKPSLLKEILPENNRRMPVIPQIMSKRAENFLPLAMALRDLGYDTINWNLGCPYPMVAKKGRGSGLLSNPEAIERFLDKVLGAMPHKLSIKMRLGRHREDEIFKLLPILNRYPLKEVIIHPRTGVQMYEGVPQLDIFEQCLALCRHCVVYNGDIVDPLSFNRLRRRFPGINVWMIGRGAVSDPFLCSAIKGQMADPDEKNLLFRQFHDALYSRYARKLYGPSHLLNRMKGLWSYFVKSMEGGRALQKKINKSRNIKHYEDVVDAFFDNDPKWKSLNDTFDGAGEPPPSSGKEDLNES
jgi:tRNA-dihydrouridine synthase